MSDARGPSSVRNLLAKFENNNASATPSPPSRGRSPVDSDHSGSGRPLSKVRASFVAVERAAQSSPGPPPSGLRKSSDLDEPNSSSIDQRLGSPIDRFSAVSPTESFDKPASAAQASTEQFESKNGTQSTTGNSATTPRLGDILKGSPFEDSPGRKPSNRTAQLRSDSSQRNKNDSTVASGVTAAGEKAQGETIQKRQPALATKTTSSRPPNIAVTGKDAPSKAGPKRSPTVAAKSHAGPKTPTTAPAPGSRQPSHATNANNAAKKDTETASRAVRKKPSNVRASSQPPVKASTKSKPQAPSGPAKDSGTKGSTHNSPRSNKGQTKSPTRPVRLPSSMTASTAASAARLNTNNDNNNNGPNARPASRAGGNTAPHTRKAPAPKASSAALRAASPNNAAVRTRASHAALAPSGNAGHDRPRSRVGDNTRARGQADESFLARMMRPTASSANKMNDKPEAKSPPRASKTAKAPARKVSAKQNGQQNGPPSTTTASPPPAESRSPNGDASPPKIQEPDVAEEPVTSHPPQTEPLSPKGDALPPKVLESDVVEQDTSHPPETEPRSPKDDALSPKIQEPEVTEEPELSHPPQTEPRSPKDDALPPTIQEPDIVEEPGTSQSQPPLGEATETTVENPSNEAAKPIEAETPAEEL